MHPRLFLTTFDLPFDYADVCNFWLSPYYLLINLRPGASYRLASGADCFIPGRV